MLSSVTPESSLVSQFIWEKLDSVLTLFAQKYIYNRKLN